MQWLRRWGRSRASKLETDELDLSKIQSEYNLTHFSLVTLEILLSAGWRPNAKRDISRHLQLMKRRGFDESDVVVQFLEQYSRLVLQRPPNVKTGRINALTGIRNGVDWLDLRVDSMERRSPTPDVINWFTEEGHLSLNLYPIGHDLSDLEYCIDESGLFIGLYGLTVFQIGTSGNAGIERWCTWTPSTPFEVVLDLPYEDD